MIFVLLVFLAVLVFLKARKGARFIRRPVHPLKETHGYVQKKPEWVCKEVVRLKALMPQAGCRAVATTFNSLHHAKGERVGKTYVAKIFKRHGLEILQARRKLKNRPLTQGPRGLTYAMDLTFVHEDAPPVLAVLDHGTRALLSLRALHLRTTIGERIFTSWKMTWALFLLGVRPQRIDPYCPWQNGRVERVFRTLKEKLSAWWHAAGKADDIQGDLDTLRTWYNHARPHQSLAGLTPALAWAGVTQSRKEHHFFEAWDGILTGFVTRP